MHLLTPGLWSVAFSDIRAYSTFLAAAKDSEFSQYVSGKHIYVFDVTPINLSSYYGGAFDNEIKRSVVSFITPEGHIRYARCADTFIKEHFYLAYEE